MIQLTLVQIDNYGPWTTSPSPKREAYLQALQAEIYLTLQKKFSEKKALLFPMRYDNMMAVTNGMDAEGHGKIMEYANSIFPVSVSMAVAKGKTPYEAQARATEMLTEEGGARSKDRRAVLKTQKTSNGDVKMAHIDVNGITEHTDADVYCSYSRVVCTEKALIDHLTPKGALVFYMGGDNYIAPCNGITKEKLTDVLDKIEEETTVALKAGLGIGRNAEDAVVQASLGLKEIRLGANQKVIVKRKK
jgi:GTP cyclohydrolase IIa